MSIGDFKNSSENRLLRKQKSTIDHSKNFLKQKFAIILFLVASIIATCESLQLAPKLELDPKVFFDIATKAWSKNWS